VVDTELVGELVEDSAVVAANAHALEAVDELLWNRTLRAEPERASAESLLYGAWCNATFEGAEVPIESLRSDAADSSPMGATATATLRMYAMVDPDLFGRAPLQALARMHAILAAAAPGGVQGQPRQGEEVVDPLRLKVQAPAAELPARLQSLARLLTSSASLPAVQVAGIAHAELASAQPFERGSGLIARAASRAVMQQRGLDPDGWSVPEAGLRALGRPKYVAAIRDYAAGSREGAVQWLVLHAQCVAVGAQEAAQRLG